MRLDGTLYKCPITCEILVHCVSIVALLFFVSQTLPVPESYGGACFPLELNCLFSGPTSCKINGAGFNREWLLLFHTLDNLGFDLLESAMV